MMSLRKLPPPAKWRLEYISTLNSFRWTMVQRPEDLDLHPSERPIYERDFHAAHTLEMEHWLADRYPMKFVRSITGAAKVPERLTANFITLLESAELPGHRYP